MSTDVDITLSGEGIDASGLRVQWVGGFYPAGSVIALQLVRGRGSLVGEKLYNPADPAARARLERLAKDRSLLVGGVDVYHGEQARRELRTLLDRAESALLVGGRRDWQRAVSQFQGIA